jgi:hypothetical protein
MRTGLQPQVFSVIKASVPVLNHISRTSASLMFKLSTAAVCMVFLSACAAAPVERTPAIQISGMVIENQTQMYVTAVRLLVPVTGNFVSCGNIPPGSMCSTTFPEATYTGDPVEVTWSQGGQIHSTGQFEMHLPLDLEGDKPAVVRVVISAPGSAGAIIVQRPE